MTGSPAPRRHLPAVLMGLANLTFGAYGALCLMTVPQLLAARGVAQVAIASVTALALVPTFCGFLVAPILDVRFSRRTYAIGFGLLTAAIAFVALCNIAALDRLTPLLMAGFLAANLYCNALCGWLGAIVPAGQEARLAAGFTVGNIAGFGIGAILFITCLRGPPGMARSLAYALAIAAPLVLLLWIPAAPGGTARHARQLRDAGPRSWRADAAAGSLADLVPVLPAGVVVRVDQQPGQSWPDFRGVGAVRVGNRRYRRHRRRDRGHVVRVGAGPADRAAAGLGALRPPGQALH